MELVSAIIFALCLILWVVDRYPPAIVALGGCCAMILFQVGTVQEVFAGFTNDVILIVFGTEILGIACQESGLASLMAKVSRKIPFGKSKLRYEKKLVLILGIMSAFISAILNNQVVSVLVLVICISIAKEMSKIDVRDITLPIIYFVILGGQCTLIGAPATLVAASLSEDYLDSPITMFEFLPLGGILLIVGAAYIYFSGLARGVKIWGKRKKYIESETDTLQMETNVDRRKCAVVILSVIVMLILFAANIVSVGTAAVIAALICFFGFAADFKKTFAKVDWNILIWLGCSIGIANILDEKGVVQKICDIALKNMSSAISPMILLAVIVIVTTIISNLIANTTTVIMLLPFTIQIAQQFGFSPKPFVIAVTMAAGLSVLTPLSCGFIGMTMRLGYRFSDYVKYGMPLQLLLTAGIILLTPIMYSFT